MSDSNGQYSKDTDSYSPINADRIDGNDSGAFFDLLDQVVSATGSSEAQFELRNHLKSISQHYSQDELTVDPVLVSLVAAVTRNIHGLTSDQRFEMNHAVAETLHGDADTRPRLERLWHSLRSNDDSP
jgi:hypothetical protein